MITAHDRIGAVRVITRLNYSSDILEASSSFAQLYVTAEPN
jgi:hypothetical protein